MLKKIGLLVSCFGLASCAGAPGTSSGCTNLISGTGGMLAFCQTNDRIAITETGVATGQQGKDLRIIDDPRTLAALAKHLRLNGDLRRSRAIVRRACVINGDGYINIRTADLERLLKTNQTQASKYSVAE